jgi:hypothetical protein
MVDHEDRKFLKQVAGDQIVKKMKFYGKESLDF